MHRAAATAMLLVACSHRMPAPSPDCEGGPCGEDFDAASPAPDAAVDRIPPDLLRSLGAREAGIDAPPSIPFQVVWPCATERDYVTGVVVRAFDANRYDPPCLRVPAGATVHFIMDLKTYPLKPSDKRGDLEGNPIPARSSGTDAEATFTRPGFYGFYSGAFDDGLGLTGVIWVGGPPPDGGGWPTGPLALAPTTHEFQPTLVKGTDSVTFTAANLSPKPIARPLVSVTGKAFVVPPDTDECSGLGALDVGATCSFVVQFQPPARGAHFGTVAVAPIGALPVTSALSGIGVNPARLVVSPTALVLDGIVGKTSSASTMLVANAGDVPSGVQSIQLRGVDLDDFILVSTPCTTALPPLGFCQFGLAFRPRSAGVKTATLQIAAIPGDTVAVPLTGKAVEGPILGVTPTMVDFGTVPFRTTSPPTAFEVKNSGSVASPPLLVGPGTVNFMVTENGCSGLALPPGDTCHFSVVFAPTFSGPASWKLMVSGGDMTSVQLTGMGP